MINNTMPEYRVFPSDPDEREYVADQLIRGTNDELASANWRITDKAQAVWAVRRLAEAEAAMAENQRIADAERARIDAWLSEENATLERTVAFFTGHLEHYHRTILEHDPRAPKTIKTPWGRLQMRAQQPEVQYDDSVLLEWLKINRPDLIRTKESPDKAELRRTVVLQEVTDSDELRVVDQETGEVVAGVTARRRAPAFSVKVDP